MKYSVYNLLIMVHLSVCVHSGPMIKIQWLTLTLIESNESCQCRVITLLNWGVTQRAIGEMTCVDDSHLFSIYLLYVDSYPAFYHWLSSSSWSKANLHFCQMAKKKKQSSKPVYLSGLFLLERLFRLVVFCIFLSVSHERHEKTRLIHFN